jgi:hypothetical protein
MTNFNTPPPPPPPAAPMGMSVAGKPPRPAVTVGAALMVAGGALMIVGSFLNWFDFDGESFNGFSKGSENEDGTKDGPVFSVLGGLALAFGFVQFASKKMLALGILGIIVSAFGLIAAFADLSDVNDLVDLGDAFGVDASAGPGLYVVILGSVLAIAGSIATVAKRRA